MILLQSVLRLRKPSVIWRVPEAELVRGLAAQGSYC